MILKADLISETGRDAGAGVPSDMDDDEWTPCDVMVVGFDSAALFVSFSCWADS